MEKALEDLAAAQGTNPQGNSPETEAAESVYLAKKKLSWHCKKQPRTYMKKSMGCLPEQQPHAKNWTSGLTV